MSQKKIVNGVEFSNETPEELVTAILNTSRDTRVRVWLGKDGKSWNEENDICGYIGRSTGQVKIPLLVNNSRSLGGGALMDGCIIKMVETKTNKVLYQHPDFCQSLFTTNGCEVFSDGELYGKCKSEGSAQRLSDFMNGKRHAK